MSFLYTLEQIYINCSGFLFYAFSLLIAFIFDFGFLFSAASCMTTYYITVVVNGLM